MRSSQRSRVEWFLRRKKSGTLAMLCKIFSGFLCKNCLPYCCYFTCCRDSDNFGGKCSLFFKAKNEETLIEHFIFPLSKGQETICPLAFLIRFFLAILLWSIRNVFANFHDKYLSVMSLWYENENFASRATRVGEFADLKKLIKKI